MLFSFRRLRIVENRMSALKIASLQTSTASILMALEQH